MPSIGPVQYPVNVSTVCSAAVCVSSCSAACRPSSASVSSRARWVAASTYPGWRETVVALQPLDPIDGLRAVGPIDLTLVVARLLELCRNAVAMARWTHSTGRGT
jgi:hypothetical protein